jgi:hypothetical protein
VPAQNGPDARGSKDDAYPCELTLDPAIAPGAILPGQAQNDCNGAEGNTSSAWATGVNPFAADQVPVPAEQGFGLNEESASTPRIKQPTQPGEQRSITGLQGWAGNLATEDRHLVAKDDNLDRQLSVVVPQEAEQFEDSDEGEVEKRQSHGPVSSHRTIPTKSCSDHPDDILGTHRLRSGAITIRLFATPTRA